MATLKLQGCFAVAVKFIARSRTSLVNTEQAKEALGCGQEEPVGEVSVGGFTGPRTTTATDSGRAPPARGLAVQEPPGSPRSCDAEEIAAETGRHVEGKQELRAVRGSLRVGCPSTTGHSPPPHRCVPRAGQPAQLPESAGWKKLLAVSCKRWLLPAFHTSPWFFPQVLPCSISAMSTSSPPLAAAV